jgi:Mitochondrial carrier protein
VSFIGSGFAEFLSLAFYYPFDLIKTRMQVVNKSSIASHRYTGVLDATIKIMSEGFEGQKCDIKEKKTRWQNFKERMQGVRNLYKGGFVFGLSYVAYMAVQFSLFESILLYLEKHHILE